MKKLILIFFLLISTNSFASECNFRDTIKNIENSVVEIKTSSFGRMITFATGFFISSNIVMTNYHVVKDYDNIVMTINDHRVDGIVFYKNSKTDIALIKTKVNSNHAVTISKEKVYKGQQLFMIGHPAGYSYMLNSGVVMKYNLVDEIYKEANYFIVNMETVPGWSGSPVFDECGNVYGIHFKAFSLLSMNGDRTYFINYSGIVDLTNMSDLW